LTVVNRHATLTAAFPVTKFVPDKTLRQSIPLRVMVSLAGLFLTVFFAIALPAFSAEDDAAEPDLIPNPDDPRVLSYECVVVAYGEGFPQVYGTHRFANLDDDPWDEEYQIYTHVIDSCHFRSALLIIPHDVSEGGVSQYNGPFLSRPVLGDTAIDVTGNPGADVILTRQYGDTIFFEIVSYDKTDGLLGLDTAFWFPAAVARGFPPRQYWHSTHVMVVVALDLNGDGHRDLIYTRPAKPDSSIDRGLVAYDVNNQRQLWFYPTADLVNAGCLDVFDNGQGDSCLVAAITSTGNRYSANGMSSQQAYAVALDLHGRELWRHTIGGSMFYPRFAAFDVDGDGRREACIATDPDTPESNDTILRVYDPFTGAVKMAHRKPGASDRVNGQVIHCLEGKLFLSSLDEGKLVLYRFGRGLSLERTWVNDPEGPAVLGWMTAGPYLIGGRSDHNQVVFDADLQPLAMFTFKTPHHIDYANSIDGPVIKAVRGYSDQVQVRLKPQPMLIRLYARYKTLIQILTAAALIGLLLFLADRLSTWHQAVLGVPTLRGIDALVLLLDRSCRLVYVNHHRLAEKLVGKWRRGWHCSRTALAGIPELMDAISQSYDGPLRVYQQRLDTGSVTGSLEISIYPYIDRHNTYRGKIVVLEQLDAADVRQWRIVLGEAAQNWVHRLKHHFGTIRLVTTNLLRDPVIAARLNSSPELNAQVETIVKEVMEGSDASTKILKYLKNPRPRLLPCDLGTLVQLALTRKLSIWNGRIDVSFSQQEDVPRVQADPDQMREVFDNLLANAAQAMPNGGRIAITARLADGLLHGEPGRAVEVSIEDTGSGIAEKDLPRIFDPNFTRTPGGTGLGLALVKEIVTQHGGEIAVESHPGQGTRFTIKLPAEERIR